MYVRGLEEVNEAEEEEAYLHTHTHTQKGEEGRQEDIFLTHSKLFVHAREASDLLFKYGHTHTHKLR
jgi:hypothetical protein